MKQAYILLILLIISIILLFYIQFDFLENFENPLKGIQPSNQDRDVQVYSNYLKDGAYKEVKFDLNINPILPEKNVTIDDWRYKMIKQRST